MQVLEENTYAEGTSEIVRNSVQVLRKEFDYNTRPRVEKEDKFQQVKNASGN